MPKLVKFTTDIDAENVTAVVENDKPGCVIHFYDKDKDTVCFVQVREDIKTATEAIVRKRNE